MIGSPKDHQCLPKGEELMVQQRSAQFSGKAQKYARIRTWEFVPSDKAEEMTIGNIN